MALETKDNALQCEDRKEEELEEEDDEEDVVVDLEVWRKNSFVPQMKSRSLSWL